MAKLWRRALPWIPCKRKALFCFSPRWHPRGQRNKADKFARSASEKSCDPVEVVMAYALRLIRVRTHLRTQIWLICTHTPKASSAHTNLTHLYTQRVFGDSSVHTHIPLGWGGWVGWGWYNIPWSCIHSQLYTHAHTFGLGWVGWGWYNIPWSCIHSQLYTHTHTFGLGGWGDGCIPNCTHTHTFGGWVGGWNGWGGDGITYLGLAYIPNCTHTYLWVGVGGWGGDGNIPWTCIPWYIQQTHVGATNRNANKNNKNYHVLQSQLPLLLTRKTTAKDLYKTTCTHRAHKIHNYKNKLVHTANPFRVYRRGPCPRVQMRPLTACTDEAPPFLITASFSGIPASNSAQRFLFKATWAKVVYNDWHAIDPANWISIQPTVEANYYSHNGCTRWH